MVQPVVRVTCWVSFKESPRVTTRYYRMRYRPLSGWARGWQDLRLVALTQTLVTCGATGSLENAACRERRRTGLIAFQGDPSGSFPVFTRYGFRARP